MRLCVCVCKAVCMTPSVCEAVCGAGVPVCDTGCVYVRLCVRQRLCVRNCVLVLLCVLVCERDLVLPGYECTFRKMKPQTSFLPAASISWDS